MHRTSRARRASSFATFLDRALSDASSRLGREHRNPEPVRVQLGLGDITRAWRIAGRGVC